MTDMALDRDLRDLFATGPRAAPAATLQAALGRAALTSQRRPRFRRFDRRAWPPIGVSISDPGVHRIGRLAIVALLVLLLAAIVAVGARLLVHPPSVELASVGQLSTRLQSPSAMLWVDGRVLITGASGSKLLFDPATGASETLGFDAGWDAARAVVLVDTRVVLLRTPQADGAARTPVDVAFYDPATREMRPAGSFMTPWFGSSTLVLRDGRVLISGGVVFPEDLTPGDPSSVGPKDLIRMFDPATGTTSDVGHLVTARFLHQMLELDDGRILVVGGGDYGADPSGSGEAVAAEVFDLTTGLSKVVGTLEPAMFPGLPFGTRLADGRILIRGRQVIEYPCGIESIAPGRERYFQTPTVVHQQTFVFDPASDTIAEGPLLPHSSGIDNVVPLRDGRALLFGYYGIVPADCNTEIAEKGNPWLAVVDLSRSTVYESHDPTTGLAALRVDVTRIYGAGVALPDGRVVLVGDEPGVRDPNIVDMVTVGP